MASILLAEKDPELAKMIVDALAGEDDQVAIAKNKDEAIDLVKRQQFDVIILDYYFLRADRRKFIKALQREQTHGPVPVIMVIGEGPLPPLVVEAAARLLRVSAVLPPPFDEQQIRQLVDRVVRSADRD